MFRAELVPKEEVWRRRLVRFQNGRLTVAKFCQSEGVSVPAFYQWRKRLAAADTGPPGRRPSERPGSAAREAGFLPVRVLAHAVVELRLPNGVRVEVPAGDREALRIAIEAAGRLPNGREQIAEVAAC
jgi:hypothetical protein